MTETTAWILILILGSIPLILLGIRTYNLKKQVKPKLKQIAYKDILIDLNLAWDVMEDIRIKAINLNPNPLILNDIEQTQENIKQLTEYYHHKKRNEWKEPISKDLYNTPKHKKDNIHHWKENTQEDSDTPPTKDSDNKRPNTNTNIRL